MSSVLPESLRVVLLANTDWYLANFRFDLARALREGGAEVHCIAPAGTYLDWLVTLPWCRGIARLLLFGIDLATTQSNRLASISDWCSMVFPTVSSGLLQRIVMTLSGIRLVSLIALCALTAQSAVPVYALGGMSLSDIPVAQTHGAQGIAAISCFWN